MKTLRVVKSLVVCLAYIGLVIPVHLVAAAPPDGRPPRTSTRPMTGSSAAMHDIALGPGGRLTGIVVDGFGKPVSRPIVLTSQTGAHVGRSVSSADGRFAVDGLQGGIYRLSTKEASLACRLWTVGAAPPAAVDQVLVVSDAMVQRGQRPIGELLCSPPVLAGLIIIAAIAIPIAVHNSQNDAS